MLGIIILIFVICFVIKFIFQKVMDSDNGKVYTKKNTTPPPYHNSETPLQYNPDKDGNHGTSDATNTSDSGNDSNSGSVKSVDSDNDSQSPKQS